MDEQRGRRTACGLLSTGGGSIPIFREENSNGKSGRCCNRIGCSAGLFSKKGKKMNHRENNESPKASARSTVSKITKQSTHKKSLGARSGGNQREVESNRESSSNPSTMRIASSQSTGHADKSASRSARADRKKNSLTNSKDRLMSLVKRTVALDALRLYIPSTSENLINRGVNKSRKRSLNEENSSSKTKNVQTSPSASSSGSTSASRPGSVSRAQQAPKRTKTQNASTNTASVKARKNPSKKTQRKASEKRERTIRSSNNVGFVDQHREMRMDIDGMTYEELLALGERIGIVSTGLSEEVLSDCIKISTYAPPASSGSGISDCEDGDIRCSICQEEYVCGDEVGKLACKHYYHVSCINQWFQLKNWCPVCRASASPATQRLLEV